MCILPQKKRLSLRIYGIFAGPSTSAGRGRKRHMRKYEVSGPFLKKRHGAACSCGGPIFFAAIIGVSREGADVPQHFQGIGWACGFSVTPAGFWLIYNIYY